MFVYTVVTRGKAGKKESFTIEAVSRADVFAVLKRDYPGVNVINILDGDQTKSKRHRYGAAWGLRRLLIVLLVALVFAAAWYFLFAPKGTIEVKPSFSHQAQ